MLWQLTAVGLWSFDFGGPKNQEFWPRINLLQGNCFILWIDLMASSQNVPKLYFQTQFNGKNQLNIFLFFSFKIINLGDHFLLKTFLFSFKHFIF